MYLKIVLKMQEIGLKLTIKTLYYPGLSKVSLQMQHQTPANASTGVHMNEANCISLKSGLGPIILNCVV